MSKGCGHVKYFILESYKKDVIYLKNIQNSKTRAAVENVEIFLRQKKKNHMTTA